MTIRPQWQLWLTKIALLTSDDHDNQSSQDRAETNQKIALIICFY
jgi:hypothetical protein